MSDIRLARIIRLAGNIRHHLTIVTPIDNGKPCALFHPLIGYQANRDGPAIQFAGSVRMAVWMEAKSKQLGCFRIGDNALNPTFSLVKIEMVRVIFSVRR